MQLNDFKNFVCYYQLTTVNLVQSVLYLLREFKVKVEWTNPGVWGGVFISAAGRQLTIRDHA